MDAMDEAYLVFLEEEFAKEAREEAEKRARHQRAHTKADMSANSPLRQWVFTLCMNIGGLGLSSLLAIGIAWMINEGGKGPFFR